MSRILYTPRQRKKPKRASSRSYILGIAASLVAIIMLLGAIFLLRLPGWQVSKIEFSGLETLDSKELENKVRTELTGQYAFLVPRSSIFLAGVESLSAFLKKEFPVIGEIRLEKKFPNTLSISVSERKVLGILCNDLEEKENISCVYIDTKGFAVDKAPNSTGSLIVKVRTDFSELTVGSNVLDSTVVERILFLGSELKKKTGAGAIEYEYSSKNPKDIVLRTHEGFRILFLKDSNFENVFKVLRRVLDEEIKDRRAKLDYVDLRFGNKVFFKFR